MTVPRLLVLLLALALPSLTMAIPPEAPFRPDRLLVKPKPGQPAAKLEAFHLRHGAKVTKQFKRAGQVQLVQLGAQQNVRELIAQYQASGLVEFAEPDYLVSPALAPNDPKYQDGTLWHLHNTGQAGGVSGADIHAATAWDTLTSASEVIVAVIDSGVRYTHEDLAGNMWVNPGEIPGNGVDDDGNGYVDDVHGINAPAHSGNPIDLEGHGTQVAGMLGAVGNNSLGVVGIAWNIKLMACRYSDDAGNGSISDVVECIHYAQAKGARIMNGSFVVTSYSATLYEAVRSCRDAGIIFVAAAGNNARDTDLNAYYPANFDLDNVVSVAATTRSDGLASFSNFGATTVDLAAPGSGIYTTQNSSDTAYVVNSGTSFAVPLVSGTLALLQTRFPSQTYRQHINRLLATTDPLPSLSGRCVTGGRLNVAKALGPRLTAEFTPLPAAGLIPLIVQFTNTSFGAIASFAWDFGDGSTSQESNPTHTYEIEGNYQATLTVTHTNGETAQQSIAIAALSPYQVNSPEYQWLTPANPVTVALSNDTVSAAQPLPFPFRFYGRAFTELYLGDNGLLGFSPEGLSQRTNTDLLVTALPNNFIAPFWDDLNPAAGGQVTLGTVGVEPHRKLVISWIGIPYQTKPTASYTFQAVLCEGTQEILFQYQEVQAETGKPGAGGEKATIGLEHSSGLVASRFSFNGSTPLTNHQAILFSPKPASLLHVTPSAEFVASGPVGGPFTPASEIFTLANEGGGSLLWSARPSQPWVDLSATHGLLAPGETTNLTWSLNAQASTLPAGEYLSRVAFTNLNQGFGNTEQCVRLSIPVAPTLTLIGAPGSGPFAFKIQGEPLRLYVIQVTTNLLEWTPVWTNSTGLDGNLLFVEEAAPVPFRFFRVQAGAMASPAK